MKKTRVWIDKAPGEAILLMTAIIWGIGLVAQRQAMESMQPFAFIALRFFLGCLVLLPALVLRGMRAKADDESTEKQKFSFRERVLPGIVCGLFMFAGTSSQQLGIMTTSASKAGFLTSLYLVLVPVIGLLFGKKANSWVWIGVALAMVGVYFLSVDLQMTIERGDIYLLIGALFWAMQILALDHYSSITDTLELAFGQFLVVAVLGLVVSLSVESGGMSFDTAAWGPLLFSGIVSVAIGFTFQVVGQSKVDPALASLIMSLEAVFALFGGMLLLNERLTNREWWGCLLMLAAVVLVQVKGQQIKKDLTETQVT